MTNTPCPLCAQPETEQVFRNTAMGPERGVLHCPQCDLFFVWPQPGPERLAELYEQEWGWDYGMPARGSLLKRFFRFVYAKHQKFLARERARHLFRLVPDTGSHILEIGSGNGDFIRRVASRYDRVEGVEPGLDRDMDLNGARLRKQAVDADIPCAEPFDAICMYMVLEHLPDPLSIVRRLMDCLRPEGKLVLEVPHSPHRKFRDMDDFQLKKVFDNVHLFHFSRGNVALLAEKAGGRLFEYTLLGKREMIPGFNVFAVYPGSSRKGTGYKLLSLANLAALYIRGILGLSLHAVLDEKKTRFADGHWIRFVLEKAA